MVYIVIFDDIQESTDDLHEQVARLLVQVVCDHNVSKATSLDTLMDMLTAGRHIDILISNIN